MPKVCHCPHIRGHLELSVAKWQLDLICLMKHQHVTCNVLIHHELFHTIVQAHVPTFVNEIEASLAHSFPCDVSMYKLRRTMSSN